VSIATDTFTGSWPPPQPPAASAAQNSTAQRERERRRRFFTARTLAPPVHDGVGRPGARDKVVTGQRKVTDFNPNRKIYRQHVALDTDRDGIACERH